jgi:hypothetical protein
LRFVIYIYIFQHIVSNERHIFQSKLTNKKKRLPDRIDCIPHCTDSKGLKMALTFVLIFQSEKIYFLGQIFWILLPFKIVPIEIPEFLFLTIDIPRNSLFFGMEAFSWKFEEEDIFFSTQIFICFFSRCRRLRK